MPISFSKPDGQRNRRRWLVTVLLIYGAICVGLLGYFVAFPDKPTQTAQAEKRVKQGRYEGVIANWNQYRAKNLRAEAR